MQQCSQTNLAKIARTSELILQKRKLSCRSCPVIYGFMTGWLAFWCFEIAFISWCVLIDTRLPWLWKFFVNLRISTSFYRCFPFIFYFRTCRYFTGLCSSNIPRCFLDFALFPVELAIYYERLAERIVVFFLSISWELTSVLINKISSSIFSQHDSLVLTK